MMGDWKGQWIDAPEKTYESYNPDLVARVVGLGEGRFEIQLLETFDRRAAPYLVTKGEAHEGVITFRDGRWEGRITADTFNGKRHPANPEDPPVAFELKKWVRRSYTLNQEPPPGAIVLFQGDSLSEWTHQEKDEPTWKIVDGVIETVPRRHNEEAGGDLLTRRKFGDCHVHLEFRLPYEPAHGGQDRANSGVYLQGLYEAQILDSYGRNGYWNECGALYKVAPPKVNASAPPGYWQTYDIEFRTARFDNEGRVIAYPQMTVRLNGVLIHHEQVLFERTSHRKDDRMKDPPELPGPILLQDHGHPIQFRNIWVQEL